MREAREAGPTLDRSSTTKPSSRAAPGIVKSKVLRQRELAARDDVLLSLGGAATDRVEDRVAVRRLRPAAHRRALALDAKLRARRADIHRRVGEPLRELGGEELVGRRLAGRRRAAAHRFRDEAEAENARHLGLGGEPRDLLADHRVVAERLPVALLRGDVLAEDLEPLLDRREREHREALEIERFRDVLKAAIELADHVVVAYPDVVEEDGVGALVPHRLDSLN